MSDCCIAGMIDAIHCLNCEDGMRRLPDGCIDLTVTSPPYDNIRDYHGYSFDFEAVAKELYRVTVDGGVVVWIVADATIKGTETGTSFRQVLGFKDVGFNIHDTMIWVKSGGGAVGSNLCYRENFEYMFVLAKGKPKSVHLIRDHANKCAGQKKTGHGRRFVDGTINDEGGRTRTVPPFSKRNNWWLVGRAKGYGGHPAAFPLRLARDHVLSWSNQGDIVMDPFMGSGTTAIAALETERRFIGFEISPEYCTIAEERIRNYRKGIST